MASDYREILAFHVTIPPGISWQGRLVLALLAEDKSEDTLHVGMEDIADLDGVFIFLERFCRFTDIRLNVLCFFGCTNSLILTNPGIMSLDVISSTPCMKRNF